MENFISSLKTILALFGCLLLLNDAFAQTTTVKYYNNKSLLWEVKDRREAKYKKIDTRQPDGLLISELYLIKRNQLIKKEVYKKNMEPTDIWIVEKEGKPYELDYNFSFYYTDVSS